MKFEDYDNIEKIVEEFRKLIVKTLINKYEDASIAGLCSEGAWELAVDAIKNLDLKEFLKNQIEK